MKTAEVRRFSCVDCKRSFDLALSPATADVVGDADDIEAEALYCPFCAAGELKAHQDSPTVVATAPAAVQEFRMKHLDYHWLDLATALTATVHLKATNIPYELIEKLSIAGQPAHVHRLVYDDNNHELVMSVLETWRCLPKPLTQSIADSRAGTKR